jgi:hypothetical protein
LKQRLQNFNNHNHSKRHPIAQGLLLHTTLGAIKNKSNPRCQHTLAGNAPSMPAGGAFDKGGVWPKQEGGAFASTAWSTGKALAGGGAGLPATVMLENSLSLLMLCGGAFAGGCSTLLGGAFAGNTW